MILITMGITGTVGNLSFKPSIAEVTVILGVIIPSARSAAPPIIAGITSHLAFFLTKENKENIPPSPLLSALSVITTYFIVVCSVKVQIIQESAPKTRSGLITCPLSTTDLKIAFSVYNGEVPISPKTIPKLTRTPPAVRALTFFLFDTI